MSALALTASETAANGSGAAAAAAAGGSRLVDGAHLGASLFLWLSAVGFLLLYALPLFFAPLRWARWFGWRPSSEPSPSSTEDQRLIVYLGRCLGALALAVVLVVMRAAPRPAEQPAVIDLIIALGALVGVAHARGAIERAQPWPETAEVALYAILCGLGIWLRVTLF